MNARVPGYRPDIDGLRALAILPVVAFHAFPGSVPGGFIGVDVFFVISGYLISRLIFERLARGTFTLPDFYARRIRRIFPALAVVLAACLAWGWTSLFAEDFARLGKHTAAGAGFVANLVLWTEAGYFDAASETKPLLHLWSLGIEEQFYLVWPPILALAWARAWGLPIVFLLLLGGSFLFNVVQVRSDEVAAFYSPLTRLWELLLGGSFAYAALAGAGAIAAPPWVARLCRTALAPGRWKAVAGIAGLACLAAAAFAFDADTSFPGWRAGLPTGGALLLIAAGPDGWVNRKILSWRPLVWIGLISYPLYLWHWPLLAFANLSAAPPSLELRASLVALSVLLATATYLLIEWPIRFRWRGRAPIAALCTVVAAVGLGGYGTFANEGFYDRPINRSDEAHFIQYYERLRTRGLAGPYRAECDFMEWTTEATRESIAADCTTPGERGTVFLWGDSHAQALSAGLRAVLPPGMRLAQVTTSGCAPRLREANPLAQGGRCARANGFALQRIAELRPDLVVLAQIMAHEATDWIELARAVRERGAGRVVLVGPAPQWLPTLPLVIVNHYWGRDVGRVAHGVESGILATDALLRERLAGSTALEYISLVGALCKDDGCQAVVPGNGELMAVDNGHLSPAGSLYVAQTVLAPRLFAE